MRQCNICLEIDAAGLLGLLDAQVKAVTHKPRRPRLDRGPSKPRRPRLEQGPSKLRRPRLERGPMAYWIPGRPRE